MLTYNHKKFATNISLCYTLGYERIVLFRFAKEGFLMKGYNLCSGEMFETEIPEFGEDSQIVVILHPVSCTACLMCSDGIEIPLTNAPT